MLVARAAKESVERKTRRTALTWHCFEEGDGVQTTQRVRRESIRCLLGYGSRTEEE